MWGEYFVEGTLAVALQVERDVLEAERLEDAGELGGHFRGERAGQPWRRKEVMVWGWPFSKTEKLLGSRLVTKRRLSSSTVAWRTTFRARLA